MGKRARSYPSPYWYLAYKVGDSIQGNYNPSFHQEAVEFLASLEDDSAATNEYESAKEKIKAFLARFTDYDANRLTLAKAVALAKKRIFEIQETCPPDEDFCQRLRKEAEEILDKLTVRVYGKKDGEKSGFKTEFQFLHQFFLSYAIIAHESKALRQAIKREIELLDHEAQYMLKNIKSGKVAPYKFIEAYHPQPCNISEKNFEKPYWRIYSFA